MTRGGTAGTRSAARAAAASTRATATHLAFGSLAVGLAVLLMKTLAWGLTGSVAFLSDALESTVNLATASAALLAIRVAARPADAGHPYGHHKAEYLSAVAAGVLIVLTSLLILHQAWDAVSAGAAIATPSGVAILVSGGATLVNALWARILLTGGRRVRSAALVADSRHLIADVVTSLGVVAGVALAWATGLWWLDPALAALVAVNVLVSGGQVIRASLGGLLDEAAPPDTVEHIRAVIAAAATGAVQAHDLRTRHDGRVVFADFHLIVPGEMTVTDAHDICDRIEARLKCDIADINATIHVEPEQKAKSDAIVIDG